MLVLLVGLVTFFYNFTYMQLLNLLEKVNEEKKLK